MNSIIEEIRQRLARFPRARIEHDASSITVLPHSPDGFAVRLSVQPCGAGEHYAVSYNGSRQEIAHSPKTAIDLFAFGLSNGCRLCEYSRAGRAYRWIVEAWSPDRQRWEPEWDVVQWVGVSLLFWRRSTIRHLQNHWIDLEAQDRW